jgi:hypothetical protein
MSEETMSENNDAQNEKRIKNDPITTLISTYLTVLKNEGFPYEMYKWEAINHFQEHWDIKMGEIAILEIERPFVWDGAKIDKRVLNNALWQHSSEGQIKYLNPLAYYAE